jgi:hypothetical protein
MDYCELSWKLFAGAPSSRAYRGVERGKDCTVWNNVPLDQRDATRHI